jgi:hypothetical protein
VRSMTKNELMATQGAIEKLFNEALSKMVSAQPLAAPAAAHPEPSPANRTAAGATRPAGFIFGHQAGGDGTPGGAMVSTSDDAIQMLADRLRALEKKVALQELANANLKQQLESEQQMHAQYDALTTQVTRCRLILLFCGRNFTSLYIYRSPSRTPSCRRSTTGRAYLSRIY